MLTAAADGNDILPMGYIALAEAVFPLGQHMAVFLQGGRMLPAGGDGDDILPFKDFAVSDNAFACSDTGFILFQPDAELIPCRYRDHIPPFCHIQLQVSVIPIAFDAAVILHGNAKGGGNGHHRPQGIGGIIDQ